MLRGGGGEGIIIDWKEYLNDRYTISRRTLSDDDDEKVGVKKGRWINAGQGPCWKDPTGKTIIDHPNELWIRSTFDHTEEPRVVNVARWCAPNGQVRQGMQPYLQSKGFKHAPKRQRSEARVAVAALKRKDCHDSAQALPDIPVPPGKTLDEWGDPLPPSASLRELYPWDGSDEENSDSE